jgi:SAM-dependent methyltransferase
MSNWKHGYFADQGYTHGFYPETMPSRLHYAALIYGVDSRISGFRYLDLGCGQGLNLIIAAALHPDSEFVGVDFMPGHIAHGRALAKAAGLKNISFLEADFLRLGDDPSALGTEFDYVIAHGITAWVAPTVRNAVFGIAGRVLAPGGIFYNSYNTYPGWLSMMPFQKMVLQFDGHTRGRVALNEAQQLFSKLKTSQAATFNAQPALAPRIEKLDEQDASYLVQEYNNQFWSPLWSSDVISSLSEEKFHFLGTATLVEGFDQNYPIEMRQLIAEQTSVANREQVRDILLNQAFRRDLYTKGHFKGWPLEIHESLGEVRFLSNDLKSAPKEGEPFIFGAGAIDVRGSYEGYKKLVDIMQSEHGGVALSVIADKASLRVQDAAVMLTMLVHGGWACLATDGSEKDSPAASRLNRALSSAAARGAPYRYLAAANAGTAVPLSELDMLQFNALTGALDDTELVIEIQKALAALGRNLMRNGKPLDDSGEIRTLLEKQVAGFKSNRSTWEKLGLLA